MGFLSHSINPLETGLIITYPNQMINKDMTLEAVLAANKNAKTILEDHGLHCADCPIKSLETLEHGAFNHGLTEKELNELLVLLNQ